MTLQALFDDSGTMGQGRFMAMAGLMGEAALIAELADDWQRHLDAKYPGRIEYFKLDEALTLDGQFRHWQEHIRHNSPRHCSHRLSSSSASAWKYIRRFAAAAVRRERESGSSRLYPLRWQTTRWLIQRAASFGYIAKYSSPSRACITSHFAPSSVFRDGVVAMSFQHVCGNSAPVKAV